MRVLFLGPPGSPLPAWMERQGDTVTATADRLTAGALPDPRAELLVSHGYRFILRPEVLGGFSGRAFNLHISFLPWNRGADPNLWSFVEDTPKGVTIHHLDPGVDTGDIVAQKRVPLGEDQTLRSSYERLQAVLLDLFKDVWPALRVGRAPRRKQVGAGSFHRTRDKEPLLPLLPAGWDTPVGQLRLLLPGHRPS